MNPHHCLNASIPQHLYGFVQADILQGLDGSRDFDQCVLFGVTSIPSRCLHFSIMTECGAQWARIPIHKLHWQRPTGNIHALNSLQCWDCHGWEFSVTQYEYLRDMHCTYRAPDGRMIPAAYWFTLDHTDNGYSQYPPEHKCYHVLLLHDGSGQIAAMPNNRIVWRDDSFVKHNPDRMKRFKVMAPTTWHAESGHRNPQDTAITKD